LAAQAATTDDVAQLREQQSAELHEVLQRLDRQDSRYGSNLHVLTRKIKDNAQRVAVLEEMDRPKPVQIELTPRVGTELGAVVEAARNEQQQLSETVNRAGAIASHLHDASERVQNALQQWAERADRVETESQRLRASAKTASNIIRAMEKCHQTLDAKLNSPRWQMEIKRGEDLADRLDQATGKARKATEQLSAVLHDFDQRENAADDWARRQREARQAAAQLSNLLAESSRIAGTFDQNLNQRKKILAAMAKNTASLVDVIEDARANDTAHAPSRQPRPKNEVMPKQVTRQARRISESDWKPFRLEPVQMG